MLTTLEFILIMLATSVVGVVVFRRLNLPPMLAYLVVGSVVGPNALAIIQADSQWTQLAEFGVVFLMFSIGLEFSLERLKAMRDMVFGLGSLQVLVIVSSCLGINAVLPANVQLPWAMAFAMGAALAMSSTAMVLQLLKEQQAIETAHGRKIIGILLLQDLIVLPLLIILAAFTKTTTTWGLTIALALLKMVVVLGLLFFGGRWCIQYWLSIVARARSQELFMLNLLLITLGAAAITHAAGLSLSMGAFIAGMLISETDFRHQVEQDIKPFRDVLLGLFFITIGTLLNWDIVLASSIYVVLFLTVFIVLKFALVAMLTYYFGRKKELGSALRTGLLLAQAGEFSFVLIHYVTQTLNSKNVTHNTLLQITLAAMVLSMLLTPFIFKYADRIVMRFSASDWLQQSLRLTRLAAQSIKERDIVLIVGYGRCGEQLASLLSNEKQAYQVLDLDLDRVAEGRARGVAVMYGDASQRESLLAAGLLRARILVLTFHDEHAAQRLIRLARSMAPQLPIIVRSVDEKPLDALIAAGATEVVPDALESSLMLASHTLISLGYPLRQVVHFVQHSRKNQYAALREGMNLPTEMMHHTDAEHAPHKP